MSKTTIIAAGGLVFNEQQELLMIFRRGKWDLPKGKLDANESIETCAVREVEEETGLQKVQLVHFLDKTYHDYFDQWLQQPVTKETWWYVMQANSNQTLVPQTTEDITAICWANKTTIQKNLVNSFPNIVQIIEQYFQEKN